MHAISSYRGNRPTNKQTNKHKHRGDYNTLRRSFASAQCNYTYLYLQCVKHVRINTVLDRLPSEEYQ